MKSSESAGKNDAITIKYFPLYVLILVNDSSLSSNDEFKVGNSVMFQVFVKLRSQF